MWGLYWLARNGMGHESDHYRMTRYFISQSGEWYRLAPNGAVHILNVTGIVSILKDGKNLNFQNLIESAVLKETTKEKWVQACTWFRRFPGKPPGETLRLK